MQGRSEYTRVSPLNFDKRITETLTVPHPLKIFDSTLRKILLTPGVSPSIDELLQIASALDQAGVGDIILNVHWWGDERPNKREWTLLNAVLASDFSFDVTVYADATLPRPDNRVSPRAALDQIRALGASIVELPFLIPREGGGAAPDSPDGLRNLCTYAQSIGLSTVVGLSDVGRVDFDLAVEAANDAVELGCVRVNLLDSYSSFTVEGMKLFCAQFRAGLQRPIEMSMHAHNDFGLGTALALAAASAGVNPDVSVNSISYRSGFAALQEVVMALEVLYDVRTGIHLERLQSLADQVTACTGLLNPLQPITGTHQYLRDDPEGILDYLRDGPDSFPVATSCLAPSLTGGKVVAVWGDRHATSTIRAKLSALGLAVNDELVGLIYEVIERSVDSRTTYPRWVSEAEVDEICVITAARLAKPD